MSQSLVDDALHRFNRLVNDGTSDAVFGRLPVSPPTAAVLAILAPLILLLVKWAYFPSVDTREPPVLLPKFPLVGHIYGLATESCSYFVRLMRKKRMGIVTLPMLNGKMYLISSPPLIQAAMRNRDLSFDPFAVEFSHRLLDVEDKWVKYWGRPGWYQTMTDLIHAALTGENLRRMKAECYHQLAATLNSYKGGETIDIPNVYDWLAFIIPRAFTRALYGEKNPFDDEAIQALWDFDDNVTILAYNIFPNLLARKSVAGRELLQKKLRPYYENAHYNDPDVSALMRNRATKCLDEDGGDIGLLCKTEMNLAWASVTNTVPDLFWLICNVFSRPQTLERFRAEVLGMTTLTPDGKGGRLGVIDANALIERPFVAATYWEVHRVYNESLGNRRVMRDTTLLDPTDGREYKLVKGINLQWVVGAAHRDSTFWGADSDEFRPERWLEGQEKAQSKSIFPFGGGRNLCPGKAFAISESLGILAVLAMAFDFEGIQVPRAKGPLLSAAMRRPIWGEVDPGMKMRKRREFEDVTWSFKLEK